MNAAQIAEKHNAGVKTPGVGHNSGQRKVFPKDELKSFVDRLETLEQEKQSFADDIKDVCKEAKDKGFDVKTIRAVLKMRKQDPDERREREALLETYMMAMGMLE